MFRAVFWVILPCKMIVDRRFRGAYCLTNDCVTFLASVILNTDKLPTAEKQFSDHVTSIPSYVLGSKQIISEIICIVIKF
jgi:hypothetical protein